MSDWHVVIAWAHTTVESEAPAEDPIDAIAQLAARFHIDLASVASIEVQRVEPREERSE
jgi:hypothetical protein